MKKGIYNGQYNLTNLSSGVYLIDFISNAERICDKILIVQ